MTNLKRRIIFSAIFSLMLVCIIGFLFFSIKTENVNATVDKNTYSVSVDGNATGEFIYILSRNLPNENATKVIFEFTTKNNQGKLNYFGAIRGGFYGLRNGQTYFNGWINTMDYASVLSKTVKFEFDLSSITSTKIFFDNVESSFPYSYQHADFTEKSQDNHFGLGLRDINTDAFSADFTISCYDDTGKDLSITYSAPEGLVSVNSSDILKANSKYIMSEFTEQDTMLVGTINRRIDGKNNTGVNSASLNDSLVKLQSNADLKKLGAKDSALMIDTTPLITNFISIRFANFITETQINDGVQLNLRLYVNAVGTAYLKYIDIFALDDADCYRNADKCVSIGEEIYNKAQEKAFNEGFIDFILEGEELKKLVGKSGKVEGINLLVPSVTETTHFELYIDSIYAQKSVELELFDINGENIYKQTVLAGYDKTLFGQLDYEFPLILGKTPLGWTKTLGGNDYFDLYSEIDIELDSLSLYASYDQKGDKSEICGVYYNSTNKDFFELKSDGSVVSCSKNINYSSYEYTTSNKVVFDNSVVLDKVAGGIVKQGVLYRKSASYNHVKYMLFDKVYFECNVPSGLNAPNFQLDMEDYIFYGWEKADGSIMDFSNPISGAIELVAKIEVDEIADSDYSKYLQAYYSEKSDEICLIKKVENNYKFYLIKGKTVTEKDCKISKAGNLIVDNVAYEIDELRVSINGNSYYKFFKEFTVKFVYGQGLPDKDVKFGYDTLYFIEKPEDPDYSGQEQFVGWYLGNGEEFDFSNMSNSSLTIYAEYKNDNVLVTKGCSSNVGAEGILVTCVFLAIVYTITRFKKTKLYRR